MQSDPTHANGMRAQNLVEVPCAPLGCRRKGVASLVQWAWPLVQWAWLFSISPSCDCW